MDLNNLNRRDFLVLSAAVGCAAATGCSPNKPQHIEPTAIDAGPASQYADDGVYTQYRDQGFFVIRRDGRLFALSSVCTHLGCKVKEQPDTSFHCPCHGSEYDPAGHVTHGPAIHDLKELPTSVDSNGRLVIDGMAIA